MVDCVNIVLQKSPLWTGFLFSYLQVCPQNIVSLLVNRRDPCSFYFLFFHKGGWLIFGETLSFLRIRLGLGGGVKLLSRVWLCDPMDGSVPGFPVHHQLPELAQTHVHWVSDAIQPSHPLSSPSPPALSRSQHPGSFPVSWLFISGGQSIEAFFF